ncbi:MAG: Tn3 family transposase [Proteobacteria bacterium]|jgi:TnpA family transposase|nr:Tn3 family transposase [Pseudomonadota bacterium]
MAGKTILTPAQRTALFDPPSDLSTIERLYTLGTEELAEIFRRRRPANRIGFAVQLCYLREPGRALRADETPPMSMLGLLAEQLACTLSDFDLYADRSPTLREHRAQAEAWLGMRPFLAPDRRTLFEIAVDAAASTDRGEAIVMAMVRAMRDNNVTLPASDTFERIALVARARMRKSAYAGIARDLSAEQKDNLAQLLVAGRGPGRTTLTWLREYPESPSASNLASVIDRLEITRSLAIEPNRARTIHANRYAVMAREAAIMSAQHLSRLDEVRRIATLCAFALEMEVALTDAAVFMMEKMIGSMFRRAARTRSDRLVEEAGRLKGIGKIYAALGRLLIEGRWKPEDPRDAIDREFGWPIIERSVRETELLTSGSEDGLEDVLERYPMVRRFAPPFLAAFTFRAAKSNDPVLAAVAILNEMYRSNRRTLPTAVPLGFLRVRWRKLVLQDGTVDRRAYEIAVVVHLRERLASGAIWVEGSRAYRTLSDYLLPKPAFEAMLVDQNVPVAVDTSFSVWLDDRRQRLNARMAEVNRKALKGRLPDVILGDGGLKISPLRNAVPEEAEDLKAQLYGLLPRVKITDLLAEVAVWTGFGDRFTHVRSGDPPRDSPALM